MTTSLSGSLTLAAKVENVFSWFFFIPNPLFQICNEFPSNA